MNNQAHECPICGDKVDYNNMDWIQMRNNPAVMMEEPLIHLEYHDERANSHKYWEGKVVGSSAIVKWGRLPGYGREGTSQERFYEKSSPEAANQFILSKAYDKRRKGYEVKM
jgi:predicted DNA-binding WGR domain protein